MTIRVFDTLFETAMARKLDEAIADAMDQVATGVPVELYRERVGVIKGMRFARAAIDETRQELSGEGPKQDESVIARGARVLASRERTQS
jgi:hypothetical protein